MEVNLSKYNNSWYDTRGTLFKRFLWYFVNVIFFINSLNTISFIKIWLLRLFGAKIGKGVIIKPSVNIKYPWNLSIGNHVWIGEKVWIDNLEFVSIEDNVCISQGAMLLCGNHNYKKETFDLIVGRIVLEKGSWVGAQSVVCPGITLHSHSVLGVASVANHNLEAFFIYQGNPAVKIRKRIVS